MARITVETIDKAIKDAVVPLELKINSLVTIISELKSEIVNLRSASTNRANKVQMKVSEDKSTTPRDKSPLKKVTKLEDKWNSRPKRAAADAAIEKLTANKSGTIKNIKKPPSDKARDSPVDSRTLDTQLPASSTLGAFSTIDTPLTLKDESSDEICDDKNPFKTVNYKKPRRKPAITINGSAVNTGLQGIEQTKYIHACYFQKGTQCNEIVKYLQTIKSGHNYTAETIPAKHDNYTSFKIGVPAAVYDTFMSTSIWPINTRIAPWQPFLFAKQRRQSSS
ncbi:hypothetical protein O0L34_g6674 [Tuta absoluta]|nr:hypothetical protein O0L34_g6674 [Tuta absoluta]